MKALMLAILVLLAGCAAVPGSKAQAEACSAEVERLNALLVEEAAERQRLVRASARREDTLRRQLEAMKAIERGILEREDRVRTEMR